MHARKGEGGERVGSTFNIERYVRTGQADRTYSMNYVNVESTNMCVHKEVQRGMEGSGEGGLADKISYAQGMYTEEKEVLLSIVVLETLAISEGKLGRVQLAKTIKVLSYSKE